MRLVCLTTFICLCAILPSASSSVLSKRKGGGGGGHGGGGGGHGSGGGGKSGGAAHGAVGAKSQGHTDDECYDSSLNPAKHGKTNAWIQANETSHGKTSNYAFGLNHIRPNNPNANWFFDPYDAYYNGSFSVTIEPPTSAPKCVKITSPTIHNAYFRIGELDTKNATFSRKVYDTNPYYFRLGRSIGVTNKCPPTENKLFTSFESSNSNLENRLVWKLDSKKSGDEYDISGSITTDKANYNNHFNFLLQQNQSAACPVSHFQIFTLTKLNKASMNGTVSAKEARISWEFTDIISGWLVKGTFEGTWWGGGAKFVTSGAQPATTGEAKRINVRPKTFWQKYGSWFVYAIVFGLLGLLLLAGLVYSFWARIADCIRRRKAKQSYTQAEVADTDKDWTEGSEYSRQPEAATPMAHLSHSGPPSANPSTQHLLMEDTPHQSQAPHSPALSAVSALETTADSVAYHTKELKNAEEELAKAKENGPARSIENWEYLVKHHTTSLKFYQRMLKNGD